MNWPAAARGPLTALLIASAGCLSTTSPRVCTDILAPGLVVSVVDSLTGAAATAGSTVTATRALDGYSVSETLSDTPGAQFIVYEHPGTYRVDVAKAGYEAWSRSGIVVPTDVTGCHVQVTPVTARLVRE